MRIGRAAMVEVVWGVVALLYVLQRKVLQKHTVSVGMMVGAAWHVSLYDLSAHPRLESHSPSGVSSQRLV